jgi:hypothetical protein
LGGIRGIVLVLVSLLSLGTQSASPGLAGTRQFVGAIDAMMEIYGPGPGIDFDYFFFSQDLNDDGTPETIVTLQNQERGMDAPIRPLGVGSSVHCDGFVVFTVAGGQEWPVFYAYTDYDGFSIRLDRVDGDAHPSLVCDTDNGGRQMVWGWDTYFEFGPRWRAKCRPWDDGMQAFALPWHTMDYIYVEEAK